MVRLGWGGGIEQGYGAEKNGGIDQGNGMEMRRKKR